MRPCRWSSATAAPPPAPPAGSVAFLKTKGAIRAGQAPPHSVRVACACASLARARRVRTISDLGAAERSDAGAVGAQLVGGVAVGVRRLTEHVPKQSAKKRGKNAHQKEAARQGRVHATSGAALTRGVGGALRTRPRSGPGACAWPASRTRRASSALQRTAASEGPPLPPRRGGASPVRGNREPSEWAERRRRYDERQPTSVIAAAQRCDACWTLICRSDKVRMPPPLRTSVASCRMRAGMPCGASTASRAAGRFMATNALPAGSRVPGPHASERRRRGSARRVTATSDVRVHGGDGLVDTARLLCDHSVRQLPVILGSLLDRLRHQLRAGTARRRNTWIG